MSVSSLPEWKQLLLERKRREEEERERKEKQEEEKFASMPAWKRGIIQRRKAKQDTSPDPAHWLDAEVKPVSEVSVETIVPVHENPFILTQSSRRRGRDAELGNETEVKEKERDKLSPRSQDGELGKGRDVELKIERFQDLSEGRQKEKGRERKINVTQEERLYERGTEIEKEWGAAVHMRNRSVEAERGQEDTAEQTSITAFDVTQEVSVLKTCPQLPVSVPHSQADRGEEVTSEYATAASDNLQISGNEDYPAKHVEEELRHHRGQDENREEREETEKELSEEELEEYTSPPHPSSLAPLISNAKQGDSKAFSGEDICGVQTIQRQIGQFQLKEQEVLRSCTSPGIALKGTETQRQQSTRGLLKHQEKDDTKTHEKDQETSKPKVTAECAHSPTPPLQQLNQTVTITPPLLRSRSPDDTLNQSDCTPTPASFPRSPSPAQSPSISPSPTPSPPLFSIRSASGGKVKRGRAVTGSTTGSTTASLTPAKTLTQQTQATSAVAEQGKKKYPTVEEIEVIGGYQNLEKSCLVKNRLTPKKVSVCFDEDQLEQVCEYPSETSMLAYSPYPHDPWKLQWEEAHEKDAEAESGTITSKSAKNMGTGVGRCLRVGQCHPLLRKHNV
uniref:Phostensin/Taperin PP1-binding domain-containing protein n=1 Tax=Mola mola TaxID=94237 RepID=A0A3Q3WW80_MOLML